MENNLLYFGENSEHLEVWEFTTGTFTTPYETIDNVLRKIYGEPTAITVVPVMAPLHLEDFEEFEDGVYEYLMVYSPNESKEKHLTVTRGTHSFDITGPVIFFKRILPQGKEQHLDVEELVPFSAREINAFANWFSAAFIFQQKGKEVLTCEWLRDFVQSGELAGMDRSHDQKVVQI